MTRVVPTRSHSFPGPVPSSSPVPPYRGPGTTHRTRRVVPEVSRLTRARGEDTDSPVGLDFSVTITSGPITPLYSDDAGVDGGLLTRRVSVDV